MNKTTINLKLIIKMETSTPMLLWCMFSKKLPPEVVFLHLKMHTICFFSLYNSNYRQ